MDLLASTPDDNSSTRAHKNAHRRSRHIEFSTLAGVAVLLLWGFGRMAVCWGDYGPLGIALCHSQWGAVFFFAGSISFFLVFLKELAAPHSTRFQGRFHRSRAAWHGYRSLHGWAFTHATFSSVLMALVVCAFLWLLLASPVRF